jgi:membrane protein involved in colicin uptake
MLPQPQQPNIVDGQAIWKVAVALTSYEGQRRLCQKQQTLQLQERLPPEGGTDQELIMEREKEEEDQQEKRQQQQQQQQQQQPQRRQQIDNDMNAQQNEQLSSRHCKLHVQDTARKGQNLFSKAATLPEDAAKPLCSLRRIATERLRRSPTCKQHESSSIDEWLAILLGELISARLTFDLHRPCC